MQPDLLPAPPARFNFAAHLLQRHAACPLRPALIDAHGSLTYGAPGERVRRGAAAKVPWRNPRGGCRNDLQASHRMEATDSQRGRPAALMTMRTASAARSVRHTVKVPAWNAPLCKRDVPSGS